MNIFQMSYSQACELCHYWNYTCYKKYDLSGFLPNNSFYYPEHISDIKSIYPIIDTKLKVYSLSNINTLRNTRLK